MTRLLLLSGLVAWAGVTLLLAQLRWFKREPLVDRVAPYAPGGRTIADRSSPLSVSSMRDVVAPLAHAFGERLSRLFGISEELAAKLDRVHSPLDVSGFRLRQLGWSLVAFGVGCVLALGLRLPGPVGALFVLGLPALAFLVIEQQVGSESRRWQRRVFLELPVVSEQLGMLLSAGYSLGAGLNRLAARGKGACGRDLALVCGRIRQGLSEGAALREWADRANVDALDRLVSVLALNREAGDLGRLITEEARAIRKEVHRQLIETMERRSQQVWIPVTVATLVPGVLFLAVPFIEAMRIYAGS